MRTCPKCNSTQISKERWNHAVPNAYAIDANAANGQTGDLVCDSCGFSGAPSSFEREVTIKKQDE